MRPLPLGHAPKDRAVGAGLTSAPSLLQLSPEGATRVSAAGRRAGEEARSVPTVACHSAGEGEESATCRHTGAPRGHRAE